jgi:predicted amino acid racemase
MPTQDKLIQLSLYKQLIEAKFNIEIPWVSGGTSVAIPLILKMHVLWR